MNATMPRVVLVDDHQLFRSGVRAELEGLVEVVGDAATVGDAIDCIVATEPDVVLLDVQMPGGGGAGPAGPAGPARIRARQDGPPRRRRPRPHPPRRARLRDQDDLRR
jgi:CheY-like chemotaxis protein